MLHFQSFSSYDKIRNRRKSYSLLEESTAELNTPTEQVTSLAYASSIDCTDNAQHLFCRN